MQNFFTCVCVVGFVMAAIACIRAVFGQRAPQSSNDDGSGAFIGSVGNGWLPSSLWSDSNERDERHHDMINNHDNHPYPENDSNDTSWDNNNDSSDAE